MDKKLIVIVLLVSLIALIVVPLVSAASVCPGAQTSTSGMTAMRMYKVYPSTSAMSASGTAFTPNATCYLYSVEFWISRVGSISGSLTCFLTGIQGGTVGTNAYPSITVYDQSDTVNLNTLGGTPSWVTFTFTGDYQLDTGTDYAVYMYLSDVAGGDNSNYVAVWSASKSADYNCVFYQTSAWSATSTDVAFILNGDSESNTVTPTPPASATPTPPPNDGGMTALTNALLPALVPLLVMLIPAFLALKFVGPWGFFVGLNVGMIIAYVTLANSAYAFPLWGVVAILIADGLLLFGKVGLRDN